MKLPGDTMVIYSEDPLTAIQYNKLNIHFIHMPLPYHPPNHVLGMKGDNSNIP